MAARLGRASGMRVLFPEYHLAPEHPFPATVQDVQATYRWLRASNQTLHPRGIALSGDSAGAALCVALMLSLRNAGEALPAAAALMSPLLDLTASGDTVNEPVDEDPIFTREAILRPAGQYLDGADPTTPLASPLFASLAGCHRCSSPWELLSCCSATHNASRPQRPRQGPRCA